MALIDFLNTFSNSSTNVCKIDPLNTFSLKFEFVPEGSKIAERIKTINLEGDFSDKIGKFVQRISLPNFSIATDTNADTIAHAAVMHKMLLNPDSQTFTMDVINTKVPLLEELFYPWMREVQYPSWQYESQPYTTANITIDLTSHSDVSYHLLKCRPTMMVTYDPSQELAQLTRQVTFTFDLMYVSYKGDYSSNGLKKFANSLVNKGLKTLGL